ISSQRIVCRLFQPFGEVATPSSDAVGRYGALTAYQGSASIETRSASAPAPASHSPRRSLAGSRSTPTRLIGLPGARSKGTNEPDPQGPGGGADGGGAEDGAGS